MILAAMAHCNLPPLSIDALRFDMHCPTLGLDPD
jgi:hypothetical protein